MSGTLHLPGTPVWKSANLPTFKETGRQEGDHRLHLPPYDPGTGYLHVGLRPHRAIHSVVFGGFSAEALRDRIQDCKSSLLITADGYWRSGKQIKSKRRRGYRGSGLPHN